MSDYINPYTTNGRWLRGNLHAHTCCSGLMDLAVSGQMYKWLGYDFLAVTDHNKAHGPMQIEHWARQTGLVIVPGEENGQTGHMLELGVHDVADTPSLDYADRARALREAGGFVVAAHPQEYRDGEENVRRAHEHLHAIEIYNALREGRGTDESRNVVLWDELLTAGARLWAVATDDFHFKYLGPANGWVQVQVPNDVPVSWPLIIEQLNKGAFYASTYPTFEQIDLQDNTLVVRADRHTRGIRVIGPGGATLTEIHEPTLTWQVPSGLAYFRIEAFAGVKCAWSQPFFAH